MVSGCVSERTFEHGGISLSAAAAPALPGSPGTPMAKAGPLSSASYASDMRTGSSAMGVLNNQRDEFFRDRVPYIHLGVR
jgi:hypothetical protein